METEKDKKLLDSARMKRKGEIVRITLDEFLAKVQNHSREIDAILENKDAINVKVKNLYVLISSAIINATDSKMSVNYFDSKSGAKQDVYVFVSTHWMKMDVQDYYDFVKAGARLCGLPDTYCLDHDFMKRLFENLAFNISGNHSQKIPYGETWLNLQNGTLEIKETGERILREHRADDFFHYVLPFAYDVTARCPRWMTFLNEVLPEENAQKVLGEFIGYCLTHDLKLEKALMLYGIGSNGKSVVMDTIEALFGRANVSNVPFDEVTTSDEKRALIENKIVNISHESNGHIDPAAAKQLVSGEPIPARSLYHDAHIMYHYAKFITSYNRLPDSEYTYGFFRRWILIPFNVTITKEKQDVELTRKLCEELPGILNWVLDNLERLISSKAFTESELCNNALADYMNSTNSAILFLTSRTEKDENAQISLKDLFDAYKRFCNENYVKNQYGKIGFRDVLKNQGYESYDYRHSALYHIKLKDNEDAF